jgi:hypothetical protein
MRKLLYAVAGAAALSTASLANAAITIGATSGTDIVVGTPDNVTIPNKVGFDTTTNTAGTVSPFFEFSNDQTGTYTFALITSTPGASVTLEQLMAGGGTSILQTVMGSGNSLTLNTGTLAANTTYRFLYNFTAGTGGGTVSGNASFLQSAVPEPATWALMLMGFGGIGLAMRRRRKPVLAQVA